LSIKAAPARLEIQAGKTVPIVISVSADPLASTIKVRVGDGLPEGIRVEPQILTDGDPRTFSVQTDLNINIAPERSLSLLFTATDGRTTTKLPVPLVIQPPSVAVPPNWVRARPPEDSRLIPIGENNYPAVIERTIVGVEDRVVALLVNRQRAGSGSAFYIMRDKVWVQLFAAFPTKKRDQIGESQWNKDDDPRWPVLGVTGVEAQAFAEWLGGPRQGFLPTREQWDLAAGKDEQNRGAGALPKGWNPDDHTGAMIAVGLKKPRRVGTASLDRSRPYGCRDMRGNGREWTRPEDGQKLSSPVNLRSASYMATEPFDFKTTAGAYFFNKPNREIGFRVVIELEPMGSD
jgi:hypothetical protein